MFCVVVFGLSLQVLMTAQVALNASVPLIVQHNQTCVIILYQDPCPNTGVTKMKNLLLMRHAKSSWKDDRLTDHQRPLNKRGREDAKRIAKHMIQHDLFPDLILSSTAVRASETVELVAEELGYDDPIQFSDDLYMGEPEDFIDVLRTLGDDYETVMIVAHNPGLELYLEIIDREIEALPTSGLCQITFDLESWKEISLTSQGNLIGFWTPRTIS